MRSQRARPLAGQLSLLAGPQDATWPLEKGEAILLALPCLGEPLSAHWEDVQGFSPAARGCQGLWWPVLAMSQGPVGIHTPPYAPWQCSCATALRTPQSGQ